MYYIRTDGNPQIGAGHIMRCLSIAAALKDRGKVTIFITADEESASLISSRGFATLTLKTNWNQMEEELDTLLPILKEKQINKIIIDSYYVTQKYMEAVKEHSQIIYLDDMGMEAYPVDVLINYNIYANTILYEELYSNQKRKLPQLLLGGKYVPLRAEFSTLDSKVRRVVRDVLITTGGGDLYNAAGAILNAMEANIASFMGMRFHVVSGAYNPNTPGLKVLEKENSNIKVYENVRHMADLMKKCDVAITAAGSTLYELAALGIPTICFYFAENQKRGAESFGEKLAINCGNFAQEQDDVTEKIVNALKQYATSYEERSAACDLLTQTLDGDGASRIAEQLIRL